MNAQEGFIDVPGGEIWYKVVGSGSGAPLIAVHGGPGYPSDSLEPLEKIGDERPVLLYDQLGCGRSERPEDPSLWQVERFIQELRVLHYQVLSGEAAHIFGHSWGTILASEYYFAHPGDTRSLILAGPAMSIPLWLKDAQKLRAQLPACIRETLEKHEVAGTTNDPEYLLAASTYVNLHCTRSAKDAAALRRANNGFSEYVYEIMWGPSECYATGRLKDYDCTHRLHDVTVPTLLTCGRHDESTPEAVAYYQSLISGSIMSVFEHSAHFPHFEEEEQYLSTLRRFLHHVENVSCS